MDVHLHGGGGPAPYIALRILLRKVSDFRRTGGGPAPYISLRILLRKVSYFRRTSEGPVPYISLRTSFFQKDK